jgi:hypothetical protein
VGIDNFNYIMGNLTRGIVTDTAGFPSGRGHVLKFYGGFWNVTYTTRTLRDMIIQHELDPPLTN